MHNAFPHNSYLAAALVLAAGGFALTIGIVSGESAAMTKLLDAFLQAFGAGMITLVAYAVHSKHEED
jgi:hypothetical protein